MASFGGLSNIYNCFFFIINVNVPWVAFPTSKTAFLSIDVNVYSCQGESSKSAIYFIKTWCFQTFVIDLINSFFGFCFLLDEMRVFVWLKY